MIPNFWDQISSFPVLTMFSLVLAGFLPLLYSVWETYQANDRKRIK